MTSQLRNQFAMVVAGLALSGCADTNPPLMFGDITTYGLRLGNDKATAGGSVSLGYKAQSIAIVPVSILDEHGDAQLFKARDNLLAEETRRSDAMSVFAAFETSAAASSPVKIGQLFSTGLAAQSLTTAICQMNDGTVCETPKEVEPKPPSPSFASASGNQEPNTAADRPYQMPLIFMRTDAAGIDIGGSLAQEGLQFVIGYSNRNLALIPVAAHSAGNKEVMIAAYGSNTADNQLDTLSVVGQFKAETATAGLNLGLQRYFATGVAARNLGNAVAAAFKTAPARAGAASGAASATFSAASDRQPAAVASK